jgi:HEAT repeat protein
VRSFIDDASGRVRFAVLVALLRLGAVLPEDIQRALHDEDPNVRRSACELGAHLPLGNFVPLLDDENAAVVEAAAFALGELEDKAGVPRLCEIARSHPDALCREAAVAALGAIGDIAGKGAILQGLNDVPAIRRRAVIAASVFLTPDVEQALLSHQHDRDWQVRQAIQDILGISGEELR